MISSVLDELDRKTTIWDDVTCDSVHPDDLDIIRGRFESWKLANKLDTYQRVNYHTAVAFFGN